MLEEPKPQTQHCIGGRGGGVQTSIEKRCRLKGPREKRVLLVNHGVKKIFPPDKLIKHAKQPEGRPADDKARQILRSHALY